MKETRVASRYASSLLDLALEQNSLEDVNRDMKLIAKTAAENRDFQVFLKSPIIKADKKFDILKQIFNGKVATLTISFLELLSKKRREIYLTQIASSFSDLYNEHKGVQRAVVTSAVGLDDKIRNQILDLVKSQTKSEIELIEKIDKDLIGGFTLKIGDKQIDSSIVRSLKKLKRDLGKNPFNKEV